MRDWISIKDRFPDACERVLTSEKHGYQSVCQYIPRLKEFFECKIKRAVTHWTPLKNPPENK